MARPEMTDSKQQKNGYRCEFVEQPQKALQTECPICLCILRDPYQAYCCGKCFCSACYNRQKFEKKASRCPTCNNPDFRVFEDKGKKQALCQFKVYCTHRNSGCRWTGELGDLDRHLNEDPKPGAETQRGHCRFIEVDCKNHFRGCDWKGNLDDLENHLQTDCTIDCEFKSVGCEVRPHYKDINDHMSNSLQKHMLLLTEKIQTVEEIASENTREVRELTTSLTTDVKQLKNTVQGVKRDLDASNLKSKLQLLKENKVSWNWLVIISVIVICIAGYMLHVMKQQMDSTSADFESKLSAAHKDHQIQIAHFQNELHRLFQAAYLNGVEFNRSIYDLWNECKDSYCYTKLQQETRAIQNAIAPMAFNISYIHQGYSVHGFTITNFTKWQLKDKQGNWYSEPFYSHQRGYRFQLNVQTNGDSKDRGVYMSVIFKLLAGDYDDDLDWPASTTAQVQLLNQLEDHNHHEKTSTGRWRKCRPGDHTYSGRIDRFFKLIELGGKRRQKTQYLIDDCLQFRVYVKVNEIQ